jgi:hypothetical protein
MDAHVNDMGTGVAITRVAHRALGAVFWGSLSTPTDRDRRARSCWVF